MKTDPQTVSRFLTEAREFALRLIDAASILINEANDLRMTTAIRQSIVETATALADAKHEMMHEIVRSEEMIEWKESDAVIDAMLKGIHGRMSDTKARVKRLIRQSGELVDSGETDSLLKLLLEELELNIGDLPALAKSATPSEGKPGLMTTSAPDFHDLLVSDRYRREDEILLEHFSTNQEDPRDIITFIIFDSQGFVLFRVIDDECRYSSDDYLTKRNAIDYLDIAIDLSLIEADPYYSRAEQKHNVLIFEQAGFHRNRNVSLKEIIDDLEMACRLAPDWQEPRVKLESIRKQS
jgi:hypothetical protein